MKDFFKDNFALILSTAVSIAAIIVPLYQSIVQKHVSTMNLYLKIQYEAYCLLFHEIAELDTHSTTYDLRNLHEAAHKAMLVSTHRNAIVIRDFCAIYADFLCNPQDKALIEEYKQAMECLTILLRDEMFRFDTMKRSTDTLFKHHKH